MSVGNIEHCDWRMYRNHHVKKTSQNFIDGDVVEVPVGISTRSDMINLSTLKSREKIKREG